LIADVNLPPLLREDAHGVLAHRADTMDCRPKTSRSSYLL
jgi:hypothetical protein